MSDKNKKVESQEDLDLFLTGVESKLRGPFSSLDLSKAISTSALRGSHTPKEYLQLISKVLSRTDKVIQLRILVGLLGLDSTSETHEEIYNVLQQSQDPERHEEWVRTVSGLIQGIMFEDERGGSRESCRGDMAKDLLQKTCDEIIQRVREVDKDKGQHVQQYQVNGSGGDDDDGELAEPPAADMNSYFAPYRYSLLPRDLVQQVIPECSSNPHFQMTRKAAILSIDEELEIEKSKEAQQHKPSISVSSQGVTGKGGESSSSAVDTSKHQYPPGFRPSKIATSKSKLAGNSKASMFMPKKPRPMMGAGARPILGKGGAGAVGAVGGGGPGGPASKLPKPGIHMRRKGGAQALLSKGGLKQRVAGKLGTAAAASSGGAASSLLGSRKIGGANGVGGVGGGPAGFLAGRSSKGLANRGNRSKMQMIDVNEVDTLAKEHQERDEKLAQAEKLKSRKRKILDAAAEKGLVGNPAKMKRVETTTPTAAAAKDETARESSAPKLAEQQPQEPSSAAAAAAAPPLATTAATVSDPHTAAVAAAVAAHTAATMTNPAANPPPFPADPVPATTRQPEWEVLLNERSNKLSADDRFRVQQFFEDRFNPTPDQPTYKMKLHEARTTDPQSGQAIKETYYLELDYQTFTSKQSKKVKRY